MSAALNILIVDDRPDGMVFLSEFLHARGHSVAVSNDGQEALEAILRRHRTHDAYGLIFASLTMMRLDGLSLIRHLHRREVIIPSALYAAAGAVTLDLSQQAKQLGCRAFLEKPISLQAVERLLNDVAGPQVSTSTSRRPGTESRRRDDSKPFFGTSQVMHAPEEPPAQNDSGALERIGGPTSSGAPREAPLYEPEVLPTPAAPSPVHRGYAPTRQMAVPPAAPPVAPAIPPRVIPPAAPPVAPPSRSYYRTASPAAGNAPPAPARPDTEAQTRIPSRSYSRRPSGLFTDPGQVQTPTGPSTTTVRFRRSLSGVQEPPVAPPAPAPEASRPMACAYCRQVFLVVEKPQAYTVVCVHCGQLNRIDPR